jgi:hypothetical protein
MLIPFDSTLIFKNIIFLIMVSNCSAGFVPKGININISYNIGILKNDKIA